MKKILIGIIVFTLATGIVVYRLYNKPHRDPSSEISITIDASDLFQQYEKNEAAANEQYLDKILEVKGRIAEITTNQELLPVIVLETDHPLFGVRCTMTNASLKHAVGEMVIIKGICTGYLSDVIIVKGILVE